MYKNPFKLNSVLASDSPANPHDTLATKKKMNEFGVMEIPSYGLDDMPDKPLFDGIRAFQQANNLKVDGIMKPGGETEKAIQQKDRAAAKTSTKKPVTTKVPSQPQHPRMPVRAQPYPYPEVPLPDKGPIQAPIASPIKGVPSKPVSPKPAPKIPSNDPEAALRAAEGERLLQRLKTISEKDHTILSVFLGFAGSIGIGKENRPEDIKRVREFLDKYFADKGEDRDVHAPKSGDADADFLFDIQRYQKENGLKVDGIIHPGGETEKAMNSHPGKPGPDLPVVMPGPGEGQDSRCAEISQILQKSYAEKKELDFKIQGLKIKIEGIVEESKSIRELAGIASEVDVLLKAAGGFIGWQLLEKLSKAVGKLTRGLTGIGLAIAGIEAILSHTRAIGNDVESYRNQLGMLEKEIASLENQSNRLGCKI